MTDQTTPLRDRIAAVRPTTLHAIAQHLEARADRIFRVESQVRAEYAAVAAELRRMADETATTETQARRGDAFEAWLKAQRDGFGWQGVNDRRLYDVLDGILDLYRLHADTGTPLGEHVCEGQVVGDCACLEQPAAGARQDGAQR